jgi:hypothetical protein
MALYVLAHRRRTLGYFLLGSVPPAAAILLDNYFHSGNLFKTGYQASAVQFHAPLWEGLTGLLVSPARGLFLYSPFLLFSVWGFVRAWTQPGYRAWRYFAAACAIYLLAYSRYTYWSGGWCFGPRYLAELSPFLILAIAPLAPVLEQSRRARTLFNFLLGVAVLVQGLGAYLTWWWEANPPQLWSWSSYPVTYLLSRLL